MRDTHRHSDFRLRLTATTVTVLLALGFSAMPPAPVEAAKYDLTIPGTYGQTQFHDLSEELGLALAYRPLAPAEPLGLLGFDVGIEITAVKIDSDALFWDDVMPSGGNAPSSLAFPKLHIQKGLPFGIDVGFVYTKLPSSNVGMYGGELKWAILKGTVATPALALRGTYTTLTGVDTLDVSTYGTDVSVSKGLGPLTPYAGIGQVWIKSSENVVGLTDESISASHVFVGTKLSLLLLTFALEADFAKVSSYSFRVGLGF